MPGIGGRSGASLASARFADTKFDPNALAVEDYIFSRIRKRLGKLGQVDLRDGQFRLLCCGERFICHVFLCCV